MGGDEKEEIKIDDTDEIERVAKAKAIQKSVDHSPI
jgi:hypothetical protein